MLQAAPTNFLPAPPDLFCLFGKNYFHSDNIVQLKRGSNKFWFSAYDINENGSRGSAPFSINTFSLPLFFQVPRGTAAVHPVHYDAHERHGHI